MKKLFCFLLFGISVFAYGDFNADIVLINKEKFFDFESIINPNNIFGVSDGLVVNNSFLFSAEARFKYFRIKASDYGILDMKKSAAMTNKVNSLFVSIPLNDFFIDIGKKKISRGVGFLKSPADFLMNFSRDYTKDKTRDSRFAEGSFMAGVDYYSSVGVWTLSYLPQLDMSNTDTRRLFSSGQNERLFFSYQFQPDGADGGIDATLSGTNYQVGAYISLLPSDSIELHFEGSVSRYDTRKSLSIIAIPYVGNQYTVTTESLEWRPFVIVGGSYIFPKFTILAEYYYNGAGYVQSEWNKLRDNFKSAADAYGTLSSDFNKGNLGSSMDFLSSFESLSLCRHYLMLRGYTDDLDGYSFALLGIFNLEDFSGRSMLSASYSGWDNLTCRLNVNLDFGNLNSEFMLLGEKWSANLNWEIAL